VTEVHINVQSLTGGDVQQDLTHRVSVSTITKSTGRTSQCVGDPRPGLDMITYACHGSTGTHLRISLDASAGQDVRLLQAFARVAAYDGPGVADGTGSHGVADSVVLCGPDATYNEEDDTCHIEISESVVWPFLPVFVAASTCRDLGGHLASPATSADSAAFSGQPIGMHAKAGKPVFRANGSIVTSAFGDAPTSNLHISDSMLEVSTSGAIQSLASNSIKFTCAVPASRPISPDIAMVQIGREHGDLLGYSPCRHPWVQMGSRCLALGSQLVEGELSSPGLAGGMRGCRGAGGTLARIDSESQSGDVNRFVASISRQSGHGVAALIAAHFDA